MGCLQNQNATTGYIGLWSRLAGFERAHLTDALGDGRVVQATLMRVTIHLVSRADYWPIVRAVREPRRQWWLRATRPVPDADRMQTLAARTAALLDDGPCRRVDLVRALGGLDAHHLAGVGLWVDLVRVPPSGTWARRRADLLALAERWVGPPDVPTPADADDTRDSARDVDRDVDRDVARDVDLLVRRYLGGFGPASRRDVQLFTGLGAADVGPALDRVAPCRFRTEGGLELVDLPDAPLPPAGTPAPVRFLGPWEAVLLAHARRAEVLPERYRDRVFRTTMPQSTPTFLVDGQVAGTWRFADGRVSVSPFEPLDDDAAASVEAEATALAAFHT